MQRFKLVAGVGVLTALGAVGFIVPLPEDAGAEARVRSAVTAASAAGVADIVTNAAEPMATGAAAAEAAPDAAETTAALRAAGREGAAAREPALETITGSASYYADKFEGRRTASGVPFRQARMWAAHKTLPFGTRLRVTNLANGNEVEVEVVDRGPYARGRVLDLSKTAARQLDFIRSGHARVKIEVLERP